MLKLGKKTEYALISLLHIAELGDGDHASKREIAESYNVPTELLSKVLQALKRSGLIESIQGTRGGYHLRQPLESISVGDVIEAIEGPMHVPECTCIENTCDREEVCNIRFMMDRFHQELQDFVYSMPLGSFKTGLGLQTTSLTVNVGA